MANLTMEKKPRVAFSLEGEAAGLPLFAAGLREIAGDRVEWIANPGGPEQVLDALRIKGALQGVIGCFTGEAWLDEGWQQRVVNVEWFSRVSGVCSVGVDWVAAGSLAARVLREAGVDRLGFVGVRGQFASRELLHGMRNEVDDVAEAPALMSLLGDWLREQKKPIGLLCATPGAARWVLRAVDVEGCEVPENVALMVMGDAGLASVLGGVELSSLPIPWRLLGEETARLMCRLLDGKTEVQRILLPPMAPVLRASSLRSEARDAALEQVIRLMPDWVGENPSVAELARRAGMSRRLFELKFRERTGQSPFQALQTMKMSKAKTLLLDTEFSASEIGRLCGYNEPQVFSSAFRREVGYSPLSWRREQKYGNVKGEKTGT